AGGPDLVAVLRQAARRGQRGGDARLRVRELRRGVLPIVGLWLPGERRGGHRPHQEEAARLRRDTMKLPIVVLVLSLAAVAQAKGKPKKQILFFTKAAGNEHAVIKTVDGQPGIAPKILVELGEKNGFEVTHTKDGGVFTPEG